MTFAQPWMLLGLVTIIIPIALHFMYRDAGAIRFPAVELLASIMARAKRRIRLKRWLLLLLRIAILSLLFTAAARPSLFVTRQSGIRGGPPVALVMVIDDSLSMQLRDDDKRTLLDRAVSLAQKELDRLRPGDSAGLILAGRGARALTEKTTFDLDRVSQLLAKATPSYRSGDIEGAVQLAVKQLEHATQPIREVLLITDLADQAAADYLAGFSNEEISLRIMDSGPEIPRDNAAVISIDTRLASETSPREVEIQARIANLSDTEKELDVILEIDESEATRGTIDLPAWGTATKTFHHRFSNDGLHSGQIIIEPDQLPEDDRRHFGIRVNRAITALLINGDHKPGSYEDETFYLLRALETPLAGSIPLAPTVADVQTAEKIPLKGHDVIFVAGVENPSQRLVARLKSFVEEGGGLLISPGRSGRGMRALEQLLPGKPRSIRRKNNGRKPFTISKFDYEHPLFQAFDREPTGLEDTKIHTHLLLDPNPALQKRTVIELSGGLPLLVERQIGQGTALLLTTTIDRDWTDLPIRPGYLPLVQRITRLLARQLDHKGLPKIQVGEPIKLEVSRGMKRLLVRPPVGADIAFSAMELDNVPSVEISQTLSPGHYRVWTDIPKYGGLKEIAALGFVVEIDARESDLSRRVTSTSVAPDKGPNAPGKLPIWSYLLLATVFLMLLEAWISGLRLTKRFVSHRQQTRYPTA